MEKEIIQYNIPNLSFNIMIRSMAPSHPYRGLHLHDAIEIIWVSSGKLLCHIAQQQVLLEKGSILLINSNVIHRLEPLDEISISYIQVDTGKYIQQSEFTENSLLSAFSAQILMKPYILVPDNTELAEIFQHMKTESLNREDGFERYIKAYIYQLVAYLFRNGHLSAMESQNNAHREKVLTAARYIEQHYQNKLTLEELSLAAGCNKYQLCRSFKQATGGTIVDYMNYVRLHRAQEMLAERSRNMIEIAFECGFGSVQYFNKVFRKYMGCSPSALKKRTLFEPSSISV